MRPGLRLGAKGQVVVEGRDGVGRSDRGQREKRLDASTRHIDAGRSGNAEWMNSAESGSTGDPE